MDEPQMAPNPPDAITLAIASPPRLCPTNALAAENSSRAMPARATKLPISTNSGITDSTYWKPVSKMTWLVLAKAGGQPRIRPNPAMPTSDMATASGTRSSASRKTAANPRAASVMRLPRHPTLSQA
jgi:hypothetical protein